MAPFYGMERAAALLMRALADDGIPVSATVLSGGGPPGIGDVEIDLLNIRRHPLRLAHATPPLRRRLAALPRETTVIASGLWASVPVAAALAGSRRSYVGWEHSVLPARLRIDRRVALLANIIRMPGFRPRQFIAVSEGVRRAVAARWPGTPSAVVANIVPTPDRPPAGRARVVAEAEVRLLTTGAFRPYKNNACAIHAVRHLPDRFTLRMAGDGPQLALLRAEVDHLGLADRVAFLGRVPSVDPLLAEAHLLVHPSLSETFGFSLVEAADAGVPVATLSAAAIDELVPRYVPGLQANGTTSRSLANAIVSAVDRPWTAAENAAAWRRRRTDFAAAAVAAKWRAALQELSAHLGAPEVPFPDKSAR